MNLADRIRHYRGDRSQSEIARAWAAATGRSSGACQVTLSRYESGELADPHLSTLREIAEALGVHPSLMV